MVSLVQFSTVLRLLFRLVTQEHQFLILEEPSLVLRELIGLTRVLLLVLTTVHLVSSL